ncbi:GNAT family N-acetyltransferase [Glycomyces sp. NRRL B-16210]|uniref:GNAT family N-acetyltransferase n=1 Tax=Glycomyces sp. NRRL B-16210 TaxID=1463821 RepID=UPI0004BED040|nr:GNAT family N-acetyltransferase [Glycomyces sp. NRRL B-16210]
MDVAIRPARSEEFEAVAGLRWRWEVEEGEPPQVDEERFTAHFADWARRHADSHRCTVAVRGDDAAGKKVIGMAWMAVLPRVPTPLSLDRFGGDLQSVYLVPEERAGGIGGRMVAAALADARELGLSKVTVQAGTRSIPFYARNGFAASPKLLEVELG